MRGRENDLSGQTVHKSQYLSTGAFIIRAELSVRVIVAVGIPGSNFMSDCPHDCIVVVFAFFYIDEGTIEIRIVFSRISPEIARHAIQERYDLGTGALVVGPKFAGGLSAGVGISVCDPHIDRLVDRLIIIRIFVHDIDKISVQFNAVRYDGAASVRQRGPV